MAVPNLGSSGATLNATNNGATRLPHDGTNYVYLPGVNGNYLSTPDAAALDITGDIDLRAKVALDDWTPAAEGYLLSKWSSGQQSYILAVTTGGNLRLYWTTNGSTNIYRTSTVALGLTDGAVKWVRATLDVDNGASGHDAKFWTSDDGSSWTQLGTTVTTAGTTSIWSGSAPAEVGTISGGSSSTGGPGKYYRAQIYSGIGGTLVLDVDTSVVTSGAATSFQSVDSSPKTVTVNRATSGKKACAVTASCWLLGTDDYIEVPDNANLDFAASDSFTVIAVHRAWATFGTNDVLVAKKANTTATTQGWSLTAGSSTAAQGQGQIGDGGGTTMHAEASRATTWGVYNTGWRVKAYAYPSAFTINTIDIYLDSAVPGGTTCYVGIGVDGSQNYYYDGTPWTAKALVPTGQTGWVRCTLDASVLMNWAVDSVPQYVIFDEVLGDYITAYQGTSTLSGILNDDAYYWGSGWTSISTTHPKFRLYNVADGSATAVSGSRTSGAVSVVAAVRDVTADTLTTYLNGTAGTPVTDPTTGTLANSEVVRVGRLSGAGTEYADAEILAVAVWRRALTAAEIDLVTTRYQSRWP